VSAIIIGVLVIWDVITEVKLHNLRKSLARERSLRLRIDRQSAAEMRGVVRTLRSKDSDWRNGA
jgi:hypothetical protein